MKNLRQILIDHARRYPLMEPTDAVKLIYQNEFGGGHLIRDAQSCLFPGLPDRFERRYKWEIKASFTENLLQGNESFVARNGKM